MISRRQRAVSDAWLVHLRRLIDLGSSVHTRGYEVFEELGSSFTLPINHPEMCNPHRKIGRKFMHMEPYWILSGSNKLKDIIEYAPNLEKFSDDGVHLTGAYGPPVVDQMPYIIDTLNKDPYTRRAVMSLWRPRPYESKDIPCTLSLQFMCRESRLDTADRRLNCVATMRSSDHWLGWPYDVFTFSMITIHIAIQMGWGVGDLLLNVGSSHVYKHNGRSIDEVLNPESSLALPHSPLWDSKSFKNTDELMQRLWNEAHPLKLEVANDNG